jgi:hypothetical protein
MSLIRCSAGVVGMCSCAEWCAVCAGMCSCAEGCAVCAGMCSCTEGCALCAVLTDVLLDLRDVYVQYDNRCPVTAI